MLSRGGTQVRRDGVRRFHPVLDVLGGRLVGRRQRPAGVSDIGPSEYDECEQESHRGEDLPLTGAALLGAGLELTRAWPRRRRIASALVLIACSGVLFLLAIQPQAITR